MVHRPICEQPVPRKSRTEQETIQTRRAFDPVRGLLARAANSGILVSSGYLLFLTAFAAWHLQRTLFRSWFFSSDEYVLAGEVIRFSHLDFRQHFFDMPGTLFIFLDAAVWRLIYTVAGLFGLTSDPDVGSYTFHRLPALFALIRGSTLAFFVVSVILLYILVSRLQNRFAGALAAMLLVMSPVYNAYSAFIRVESLAMALMLLALILVERALASGKDLASRAPSPRNRIVLAGVLMGLAGGARLHALTAGVPVAFLTLWLQKSETRDDYPLWVRRWALYFFPASWIAVGIVYWWISSQYHNVENAIHFLGVIFAVWLLTTVVALIGYRFVRLRSLIVRVFSPEIIKLGLGVVFGALVGIPTIMPQLKYFLGSIQMYSEYVDPQRLTWPTGKLVPWYLDHYFRVIAPDLIVGVLLCAGTLWIIIARDRKALPYVFGAALFFFSKPLKMVASPHHVVLWLPFFFLICAYPFGRVMVSLSTRLKREENDVVVTLAAAAFLAFCFFALTPGPKRAVVDLDYHEERMHNIQLATDWIKGNAEPDSAVAIAYHCFNPDVFYSWLTSLEVPVPEFAFDGRRYIIWWGQRSPLQGQAGYACATRSDLISIKTNADLTHPGEGTDPYADRHFKQIATFGAGESEVDLFHFDFK
jgi:hypothetical protein